MEARHTQLLHILTNRREKVFQRCYLTSLSESFSKSRFLLKPAPFNLSFMNRHFSFNFSYFSANISRSSSNSSYLSRNSSPILALASASSNFRSVSLLRIRTTSRLSKIIVKFSFFRLLPFLIENYAKMKLTLNTYCSWKAEFQKTITFKLSDSFVQFYDFQLELLCCDHLWKNQNTVHRLTCIVEVNKAEICQQNTCQPLTVMSPISLLTPYMGR